VAYNPQGNRSLFQLSLLPIIPHLNYQITFWLDKNISNAVIIIASKSTGFSSLPFF
jgi:hypothetical protein